MNKKDYEKPEMMVVQLRNRKHILAVSGQVNATMDNELEEEEI